MSKPVAAPEWLASYQARFSSVLRSPLTAAGGSLRDLHAGYAASACADALPGPVLGARERLAVYNRQYWFRLLTLMQNEHKLTKRLLSVHSFNLLALRFFEQSPPRTFDLAQAADGFVEFLEAELPQDVPAGPGSVPRLAVLQAARLDEAFRATFRAPPQPPFVLDATDAERLPSTRLRWSPAVRLFEEHWPLVQLRDQLQGDGERPVPLPAPHASPRAWAICRVATGHRVAPLAPLQAELLQRLVREPLGTALVALEAQCPPELKTQLPELTRRWLADAMRLGCFTGFLS